MPKSPPPPTLPCSQCGYVNEPERVYCHNCGTKLDRSLLPKQEVPPDATNKARKRIQRMANPTGNIVMRELKMLFNVLFYAVVVSALFLMWRSPDFTPKVDKDALPRMISDDIEDAIALQGPHSLTLTEEEVNGFLKKTMTGDKNKGFIELKQVYVHFTPGVCHIGMIKGLLGLDLYFVTDYKLEVLNGTFTPTNIGGHIGRLAIHPLLMQGLDYLYQGLWTALHRERGYMDSMKDVRIANGKLTLITRGGTGH